ncbi:MAG TPA: ABC transporter substrate-binding protein [Candidatus Binatia bacterium]|jgi:phospholipid transport system substrate-binding protein
MMRTTTVFFVICAAGMILLFQPRSAAAGEPTEQIRAAVNQGVEVLNKARIDNAAGKAETIARLRKIVYPLFDFDEMARRSLGAHWRRLDPAQQKEFVAVFTELLEKTYAKNIDLYDGQRVLYTGETIDQDFADVQTKLVGKKGENYSVAYKLHLVNGKWRVYDVVAEGISLVNNYRSQFNRVMTNSSFEELIRKMKERSV